MLYKFHLQNSLDIKQIPLAKKESRHSHMLSVKFTKNSFYNQKQKDEEEETLTHNQSNRLKYKSKYNQSRKSKTKTITLALLKREKHRQIARWYFSNTKQQYIQWKASIELLLHLKINFTSGKFSKKEEKEPNTRLQRRLRKY